MVEAEGWPAGREERDADQDGAVGLFQAELPFHPRRKSAEDWEQWCDKQLRPWC